MNDLDRIMGRPHKEPKSAIILFDAEYRIRIDEDEFAQAKELIEKIGEDWFDNIRNSDIAYDMYEAMTFNEFVEHINNETDLVIEHSPEYWKGRENNRCP